MPAFRYHGRDLVAYDAFKTHCSLFPMGSEVIERHAGEVRRILDQQGHAAVHARAADPEELVELLVRERMAAIDAKRSPASTSGGRTGR